MHELARGEALSLWVGEVIYYYEYRTDLSIVSLGFWLPGNISAIMSLFHKSSPSFFFLDFCPSKLNLSIRCHISSLYAYNILYLIINTCGSHPTSYSDTTTFLYPIQRTCPGNKSVMNMPIRTLEICELLQTCNLRI